MHILLSVQVLPHIPTYILADDLQKQRKKQSNDLENRRLINDLEGKRNNKKYQDLLDVRSSLPAFQMRYVCTIEYAQE